jgi:nitroreductase
MTTPTPATTVATLVDVVGLACLAPSVHNTQPWTWRLDGSTLELYADPRRGLVVSDPVGHRLVVSCGAALHHAQVAALGLGWAASVERLPEGPGSDLLARIDLVPTRPTPADVAAVQVLRARRTDRRRFTSWLVPDGRLQDLAATAEEWGVVATALTDADQRWRVEALLAEAYDAQAADPLVAAETAAWVGRGTTDGVPAAAVPDRPQEQVSRRSRFGLGQLEDAVREIEVTDGLVVLGSPDDDRAAWLRAGEALSALWLDATSSGLSVVPLSQPIEVARTRWSLQHDVLMSLAVPHVLLRIGWPSISRTPLVGSPRRPLDDVLQR